MVSLRTLKQSSVARPAHVPQLGYIVRADETCAPDPVKIHKPIGLRIERDRHSVAEIHVGLRPTRDYAHGQSAQSAPPSHAATLEAVFVPVKIELTRGSCLPNSFSAGFVGRGGTRPTRKSKKARSHERALAIN